MIADRKSMFPKQGIDAVDEMMVYDIIGASTGMAKNQEWLFDHGFRQVERNMAGQNDFVREFNIDEEKFTFSVHVLLDFENSTCISSTSNVGGTVFYEMRGYGEYDMVEIFGCSSTRELLGFGKNHLDGFPSAEEAVKNAVLEGLRVYERCKNMLAKKNEMPNVEKSAK